jgi:hypothetical protein
MKTRILLLLAAAAAGAFASIAVASPPPGKGNPHDQTTTTGTSTTAHGKKNGKVLVCHKLPNGHYVLVNVNGNSSPAKLKRADDVLAGASGTCPGPIQNRHTTSTDTTSAD